MRDITEKATTHQRERQVLEGNEKDGGERMNKSKDWNAEENKIRTLLLLRLEFLTNHHLCYHYGQEAWVRNEDTPAFPWR